MLEVILEKDKVMEKLSKPPIGILKINVDGVAKGKPTLTRIGRMLHDLERKVLLGLRKKRSQMRWHSLFKKALKIIKESF